MSPDKTVANIGRWSSVAAGTLTVVFALALIFELISNKLYSEISFAACLLLPVAYLIMTLANSHIAKVLNKNNNPAASLYSDVAVLLGVIYGCYLCMVYYVQLTFVRMANPDPIALSVVKYPPPSAFFALDILGYTFLALSTVFLALSLPPRERFLKKLMYFHGLQGLVGFSVPLLPFVYEDNIGDGKEDYLIWQLPLLFWCIIFSSICFLMARYFRSFVLLKTE